MQTHEIISYNYAELSAHAKGVALDAYRDGYPEFDWYDFVYYDAKEIGKLMGINIDKIYFTGFSSQGDGACFESSYNYKKGSVKAVKEYAPKDEELQRIAIDLKNVQAKNFYQLFAQTRQSGHYMHEMCTNITVERDNENRQDVTIGAEEEVTELLRDFMRWIYKTLETEYNYQMEDEQIIETIEGNETQFLESGKIY